MRTVARAVPVLAVFLFLVLPLRAQDQSPIEVTEVSVDYTFGQQATFGIGVSAEAGIAEIYLYVKEQGEQRSEVFSVPFEPGTLVQATLQRDLRLHPFPPFGEVTVWWEVRDTAGHRLTTEPSPFPYVDDRFEWQAVSDDAGSVDIHTVVDNPAYQRSALDVTQTSATAIAHALESAPLEKVSVYIYPSLADLRAALEMGGREWMGGQARPELGAVLVAIPYDDEFVARMERDIPHELSHLMVYQVTGPEGYTYVPDWLDEGIAVASQIRPDPSLDVVLEQARVQGRLLSLTELCAPFPSDREVALLSYAQSASLVRFIRDRYGSAGIRALLAVYADGASCEGGIVRALHTSPERLELAWRAHLMGLSRWTAWLSDNAPWLLLWGLSLLLALPMVGSLRRT